ncbi:LacI family DNA-binding transcriptional regulator [Aureimonas endophytica]|uniref:LacI family DNA-binding transcriptional regulator n=1 Tax=Aureimonas endophytica TaxID=2027858 RepID=UPI00166C74A7|nr:LacI family DNA-binding transcriptional regulator [Aureimonas endophytica]
MVTQTTNGRGPKIRDVALHAGVSTATVSRALTDPASVRPALRDKVLEAVKALGYTPNAAARSLRAGRTRTILVVTRKRWSAPFFSEVLNGIDTTLARAGHAMILGNFDAGDRREEEIIDMMFSGHIDGAIILSGIAADTGTRSMLDAGLPIVSISAAVAGTLAIVTDEGESIVRLADHLLDGGHRRFLYLAGPLGNYNETVRWAALRAHLAGRADATLARIEGDYTMPAGIAAAKDFLAMAERPSAVVACNDEMAIGFMKTVRAAGVAVPGAVSVAGFDGIEFADYCEPTLTTIRQPRFELGAAGAETLLKMLAGTMALADGPVRLVNRLRLADSTAPLGAG